MKWLSFRGAFLLLLVFTISAPLLAQVNDTYVIPVVGNTSGANNTRWKTEFNLFNPQAHPLKVSLVYMVTGGEFVSGNLKEILVTIDPNMTGWSEEVVGELFDKTGTGSILAATFAEDNPGIPNEVLDRSFLVNSKTYNTASSGTFGQGIPGTWVGLLDTDTDGITAIAHGVTNKGVGNEGFRANFGAVNLGPGTARMLLTVYDDEGRLVANKLPFDLPPYGHMQDRLPVVVEHGSVEFFVDDPFASDPEKYTVVFPYVSIVDNRSGDGVYIQPPLLASPSILYKKGATAATTEVGKKIDGSVARRIRANAERVAEVYVTAQGTFVRRLE